MRDVEALLRSASQLRERPPAEPRPLAEVQRRATGIRRRRRARRCGLGAALVLVAAVPVALDRDRGDRDPSVRTGPPDTNVAAADAQGFVDEVLDLIEAHAYYADTVDLAAWRAEGTERALSAATSAELYPFVNEVLGDLGPTGQGEVMWAPDRVENFERYGGGPHGGRPGGLVEDDLGYLLVVPTVDTPTSDSGATYVEDARRLLARPACGWIVDLRGEFPNARADPTTLLSALAPLLGPGPAGGHRDAAGTTSLFVVGEDGSVAITDSPADNSAAEPADVPVAVLQGSGTTTNYETLAMAFRGHPSARSFGRPTAGQPVVREDFDLSDGSRLFLTTAIGVDRLGEVHDGPIAPDVLVDSDSPVDPGDPDPIRAAAEDWLVQQPACR